ncbi:MAG: bifunctional chorismate mutase/prephenate dehydratase [Candidatus Neomarinimicrobiota bacterium]
MELKEIRKQIDILDGKIIQNLNDRMEMAILAKRFKTEIEDPQREKEILDKISNRTKHLFQVELLKQIFSEIIGESKRLQKIDHKLIGFQGEHGAYSELAALFWNEKYVGIPCKEFTDVFDGVASGWYDFGIVPVENTLGGVVGPVNDLLLQTDLFVVGAIEMPVSHCLMIVPGADHREIRSVYSHSQALSQCKHFLARNKLEPISYYDTAGAARMLAEKNLKGYAVIASKLAAELYNLEIIKESVEDLSTNRTRFLILSREKFDGEGEKCSIIFSTEHKAGTLFNVLEIFAKAGINLTRIESIPGQLGEYSFFLDFVGSEHDEKVEAALKKVGEMTGSLRLIGCYKERKIA